MSSKIGSWKKINSKVIFEHPRVKLTEDTVLLPNGKETQYLKINETAKIGVTIICIKDKKILIQKEYSYPVNEILCQFPGGKVEEDETIMAAAKRELLEESGIKSNNFKNIGWYYINNRRNDNKMHVFVTQYICDIDKHGGDEEENIKSMWISLDKFSNMIKNKKIVNYSMLSAWALFKNISN